MRGDPRHAGRAPRVLYRLALMRGFDSGEAANLVALIYGLPPRGWTIKQIAEMVALREERRRQLIG